MKFKAWNGEQFVIPDYLTNKGIARWKKNSVTEISDKVVYFTGLVDNNAIEIYSDDIREDYQGNKFRIYLTIGGFVIKADYWKTDLEDLNNFDILILESLSNPQTAAYICKSTTHLYNKFEK